jgi:thiol-disulfide isomerase/thioredoxin
MMVTTNKVLLFALLLLTGLQASAQKDTTRKYFTRLFDTDKVLLEKKLYERLKSKKESDWITAGNFFYMLGKNAVSDSVIKADKVKFPQGIIVRNEAITPIYEEKDPIKKEQLYKDWVKKFPPEKLGPDRIMYDYARHSLALAFAEVDSVQKALYYANMLETGPWRGEGWASTANALLKKGHNAEAKELLKRAIANAQDYMTTKKDEEGAGFAAIGYPGYNTTYGELLYNEKNYSEALQYLKNAREHSTKPRPYLFTLYVKVLLANGKEQEAYNELDTALKAGVATPELKAQHKELYTKFKGASGYDAYVAGIEKKSAAEFLEKLPKQMINETAPAFTLKDLDGNSVSLADLKGKIVILDFWATWCGPCKASFPAMQMAVNKYKDDPNVKFLFIHTWEKQDNASQAAQQYISSNKYTFQVLMDLKDEKSHANEVVQSYNVNGIPAKFIIDKNGQIRFRLTGFEGGNDAAVQELSAMIELTRKS